MSNRCDAEMCPYWTGQGCACEVFGIERPEPASDQEDWTCPECGLKVAWDEDECLACLNRVFG